MAAALVVVKPGSMRELHWHPNADEWQYYKQGSARMTVFNTGPQANTTDFQAGDVSDTLAWLAISKPPAATGYAIAAIALLTAFVSWIAFRTVVLAVRGWLFPT
jgi:hypothetical protein